MDKRTCVRLKTCYPVEFTIVRIQGELLGLDWAKGCTQNVSKEGICLETAVLTEPMINYLNNEDIYLKMKIHVPFKKEPMKAIAEVAWHEPLSEEEPKQFLIGMKFQTVVEKEVKQLMKQAKSNNLLTAVIALIATILIIIIITIIL